MRAIKEFKESILVVEESFGGIAGVINLPDSGRASVIASWGGGWEHVSVSPKKDYNIPTWVDMCFLKDLFFKDDEVVIQIHPKKEDYVNIKNNCLHLWRPINEVVPTPPKIYI